jgi:hypothetical protein
LAEEKALIRVVLAICAVLAASPSAACVALRGEVMGRADEQAAGPDLALRGGGLLRVAGVMLEPAQAAAAARATAGSVAYAAGGAGARDRWGRRLAALAAPDGVDVGLMLLQQGFGLARPDELPPNCRNSYLQAETVARLARLGVWSAADAPFAQGADGEAVRLLAGRQAVIEGVIRNTGLTRRALFLNLGPRGAGASVEASLGAMRELERQGWTREAMRGQKLRVRGVVMEARPARLIITRASAIEWLN